MKQPLHEEFRRMQKLAGLVNEEQYEISLKKNSTQTLSSLLPIWSDEFFENGGVLYISDDSKLAPEFIKPKGIGFIVFTLKNPFSKTFITFWGPLIQMFIKNYEIVDKKGQNINQRTFIGYIQDFLINVNNWEVITQKKELENFMLEHSKIYLIDNNGKPTQIK